MPSIENKTFDEIRVSDTGRGRRPSAMPGCSPGMAKSMAPRPSLRAADLAGLLRAAWPGSVGPLNVQVHAALPIDVILTGRS
jgi:hypothetical protein